MFQPFNIKCDICGRGKFKSQSGLTRHRDTCQQKRHEQNQHHNREQSSEEYAVINPRQSAELSENSDHNEQAILETPSRDASPEPMFQLLTDEEYSATRPEDNEFGHITIENLNQNISPEPMLFDGEAAARRQEQSVTTSRHTVAKTVSYTQATKRQAGAKLTLEEVEREMPLINRKGSWIYSQ
jgi:hypothetical protein